MKKKTENCMLCGASLDYLNQAEELVCTYCGKTSSGHVKCREGHYVCEQCHNQEALKMIESVVLTTTEKDPVLLAELMMSHPSLPMLGCEHAFIAAGSLMAALKNSPYAKVADGDIKEAFARTSKQAVGGYCGLTGVCGIVPALGACFSIFLGARCGSDSEQKIVMEVVVRIAQAVVDMTGPSCCKAYVRTSLVTAVDLFAERFGIALPSGKKAILCRHADKHPHGCREEKCGYYVKASKDIFADSNHLPPAVCHS